MVDLDWSVKPTDFIGPAVALVTIIGAYYKLKGDVRVIRHDLNNVQTALNLISETVKTISTTLTTVAVQDNRLLHLEEDIRDMRRGKGYINDVVPKNG